jgi:hypothetical protein
MQEEKPAAPVPPKTHHTLQLIPLFQHTPFLHKPRNVNEQHKGELEASGFNTRIAVGLTKSVGTMWTAYSFAALAIVGLLAILGLLPPLVVVLVAWLSQTFLQLVFLPILSVGQNVLGRHAELMADEEFHTTMNSYHAIEEIMQHLSAQDAELLKHTKMLIHLLSAAGITPEQLPDVRIKNPVFPNETPSAGTQG